MRHIALECSLRTARRARHAELRRNPMHLSLGEALKLPHILASVVGDDAPSTVRLPHADRLVLPPPNVLHFFGWHTGRALYYLVPGFRRCSFYLALANSAKTRSGSRCENMCSMAFRQSATL